MSNFVWNLFLYFWCNSSFPNTNCRFVFWPYADIGRVIIVVRRLRFLQRFCWRLKSSGLWRREHKYHHHHHKHQGLDPSIRSVSRVTTALANVSSVFQLFSFLVVCSDIISKGFGLMAFFASVKASSVCIRLSCLVCIQSIVHGIRRRYKHKIITLVTLTIKFSCPRHDGM